MRKCVLCGRLFIGWGNNPQPLADNGKCCDICNTLKVIPQRIERRLKENGRTRRDNRRE